MSVTIENRESAYRGRIQTYAIINCNHIDLSLFLDDACPEFCNKQREILTSQRFIKTYATFIARVKKSVTNSAGESEEIEQNLYISCGAHVIDLDTDLQDWFSTYITSKIRGKIEDFEINGSGWTISRILELAIYNNKYEMLRGSTYIELSKHISKKRAVINVKNLNDEMCFKWAILSALHPPPKHADRLSQYVRYENELNFSGISFPMEISKIKRFEELNPTISVNVYTYDEKMKKCLPLRLTKRTKTNHIHLLFYVQRSGVSPPEEQQNIIDELMQVDVVENISVKTHYCWIKNLSRLLGSQVSKHKGKIHVCDRCLHYFYNEVKLLQHSEDCINRNVCAIKMPAGENRFISFKNHHNALKVPFCIYADLEAILNPIPIDYNGQKTAAYQQHEAFSIGYYFKSDCDDALSFFKSYTGVDCIEWFCMELYKIFSIVHPIFKNIVRMEISSEQENDFKAAQSCHICSTPFTCTDIKVRDHNHLTGEFRGAAHQKCNLKFQESRIVPVVFHNLTGYDAHFIIRQLMTSFRGDVQVIPCTDQNYIAFTKTVADSALYETDFEMRTRNTIKFKFLDSFRFMASSLDKLASYLPSECKTILHREFSVVPEYSSKIHLLERKGVFPYDFVDSWEKLDYKRLPDKQEFYNRLTESDVSDDEYQFAHDVWNAFNIKTLREYAELYLKTDILLLADVFENFRKSCLGVYGLDPAHYYTLPGYSFDAMLRFTCVNIELITDVDMLMFVENGIRGGISQCTKRYAKANNTYMKDYDSSKQDKYLLYLDKNSLYAWAMKNSLPLNGFEWCYDVTSVDKILDMVKDPSIGCLLEVDLKYDRKLHDYHRDYPLCAEKRCPPGSKCTKLLLTLYDKKKYIIHHRMLEFALQHGLKVEAIHRVLKFRQCAWLEPFIDLNTVQRTQATNDFEKNLYKLMSNAIYGKTMENVRMRCEIKLKSEWEGRFGTKNLIAAPNFKKSTIFSENLVAVEMEKMEILMNKPIIIGMAVLEISKLCMYDFHYNYMKPKYNDKCEILYTDTDSFVYEFTDVHDIYEEMKVDLQQHYDTSDYPQPNVYNIPSVNKKIPGLMKDENNGRIMTEFVGLRAKMYSVRVNGVDAMKKAKGVKRYVLKKDICFEDYLKCINENCIITKPQNSIRSKSHNVFSIIQNKIALSPFDDKRYILENNIDTLPWGHYSIIREN
jgi:hypothetical protein